MQILPASPSDFKTIQQLAYTIWPVAYGEILSKAQLDYMLDAFYSEATLLKNFEEKGHLFLLARDGEKAVGFASYEHHYQDKDKTRIHKIYVLPETQGKGAGALLMQEIEKAAIENGSAILNLNVNRFNKALHFYQKLGFDIVAEEDIELEHGYLMEDYVMEKELKTDR